jgi:hypothetical protein
MFLSEKLQYPLLWFRVLARIVANKFVVFNSSIVTPEYQLTIQYVAALYAQCADESLFRPKKENVTLWQALLRRGHA